MYQTYHLRERFKLFLTIFVPILIYQFANYSASFIDTMMTGHYQTLHLAGVAIATSLWSPFFTLSTGIVSALIPIVGQHLGRGDKDKIASDLWQFIYIALGLSVFLFLLVMWGARPALSLMPLETEVARIAQSYLSYMILGIVPFLLFSVFRSFFDALGLTRLSMYLMLLLVPFNALFNYILIYGKFGFPQMGGAGAGLGTAMAYWLLLLVVLAVIMWHPEVRSYQLWRVQGFSVRGFVEGIRLGLPIGGSVFAEVGIFSVVGIWMAKFSSNIIASHQAAMNFATLLYAFPFGVSMSMAIMVSYEIGANRPRDVQAYCRLGRWVAFAFSCLTLAFLYLFRFQIAQLYGDGQEFLQLTATFLTFALCFQFGDAFAAPLQGILRGYKDTTLPFLLMLFSYWAIPLPLGILLERFTQLGPSSYWIGLIASIFTAGGLLQLRLFYMQRKLIGR